MASKNDNKATVKNDEPKATLSPSLEGRSAAEQPEITPEIVKEGHEAKVQATDATRVSMDEINGDNIVEKLTDNPVARTNRDVAKYGTVEDQNARKESESK